MSDTQNQTLPENPETSVVETPVDTPVVAEKSSSERPSRDGDRKDRGGDRPRGPRRDGMREEEKEFKEEMLEIARVTRVTAGGRQIRFRASIVIGDGKGRIGLGVGKAGEVQMAIEKAIRDAKKNLITFQIVNGTIAHEVTVEYKASSLHIHPAHPGTGIIAGGAVRKIFSVSGIKDIIAKQHGAPNKITNARVAMKALASLKPTGLIMKFASKNEGKEGGEKIAKTPEAKKEKVTVAKKAPEAKKSTPVKAEKPVAKKTPAKAKAA